LALLAAGNTGVADLIVLEMRPMSDFTDFGSSEAVLKHIQERSDDIERAVIPQGDVSITNPNTSTRRMNPGMVIYMIGGKKALLAREDAELVLNDGILHRMRIKIEIQQP
jgi:hypothetical protein